MSANKGKRARTETLAAWKKNPNTVKNEDQAAQEVTREKTARLKSLRLAQAESERSLAATKKPRSKIR